MFGNVKLKIVLVLNVRIALINVFWKHITPPTDVLITFYILEYFSKSHSLIAFMQPIFHAIPGTDSEKPH